MFISSSCRVACETGGDGEMISLTGFERKEKLCMKEYCVFWKGYALAVRSFRRLLASTASMIYFLSDAAGRKFREVTILLLVLRTFERLHFTTCVPPFITPRQAKSRGRSENKGKSAFLPARGMLNVNSTISSLSSRSIGCIHKY